MASTFIIGDAHGQLDAIARLLREASLVDRQLGWCGGAAALWFLGDFFDRGPDGIGVVELVMRLHDEAPRQGGRVDALLGNHDALIIAAQRFGERRIVGMRKSFREAWRHNGGIESDLSRLAARHIDWLAALPAVALEGDRLLVHADALFYTGYGRTIAAINDGIGHVVRGDNLAAWDRLLDEFSERNAFRDPGRGSEAAHTLLELLGGRQIIHGHTPIGKAWRRPDAEVREAVVYAGGLCVNVDGGIYRGGPGFVYRV